MNRIRGFIACSLDGYIATTEHSIEWLKPFEGLEYGYNDFIKSIKTVVMGRRTFDEVRGFPMPWAFRQPCLVVTSSPIADPPPRVEAWTSGVPDLVRHLRSAAKGDVWIVGGGALQSEILDLGGLDEIIVSVIPVLLGSGVPLWPESKLSHKLHLKEIEQPGLGMVKLTYSIVSPED